MIALGLFKDYDDIRNSPKQAWNKVQPGDIKYKDVNGDGIVNDADMVAIGATTKPNLIYGFGVSAQWNGFDFNVHFNVRVNLLSLSTVPVCMPLVTANGVMFLLIL